MNETLCPRCNGPAKSYDVEDYGVCTDCEDQTNETKARLAPSTRLAGDRDGARRANVSSTLSLSAASLPTSAF